MLLLLPSFRRFGPVDLVGTGRGDTYDSEGGGDEGFSSDGMDSWPVIVGVRQTTMGPWPADDPGDPVPYPIALPDGVESGDLVVTLFAMSGVDHVPNDAGWTLIRTDGGLLLSVFYRYADEDEPSYTLSPGGVPAGNVGVAMAIVLRGAARNLEYDPAYPLGYPVNAASSDPSASIADELADNAETTTWLATNGDPAGALRGGLGGVVLRIFALRESGYGFGLIGVPDRGELIGSRVFEAVPGDPASNIALAVSAEDSLGDLDPLPVTTWPVESFNAVTFAMSLPIEPLGPRGG